MREGGRVAPGEAAPLHATESDGRVTGTGAARWLVASDGVPLRAVAWGAGAASRGTILLFSGRTEYAEKYARLARDLAAEGYATLAVDWRGQGLSGRLGPDSALGHVEQFADYQRDVAALVAHAEAEALPRPWFLLAHSMGGTIGLRALVEGLPVRAAVFSAPMWGIQIRPGMRPVAWTLSSISRQVGLSHRLVPGQFPVTYVLRRDFDGNALTGDREMWDMMRAHVEVEPGLGLGGPSLHWLNEALRETLRLRWLRSPRVPTLAFVGTEECIVDPGRIRRRIDAWPGARLVTLEGARHEVMMERPAIRGRVFRSMLEHFAAHA